MSIRLSLVDSNRRYAEKLAAWIHKHMPFRFSVEIITSPEGFREWSENGGSADLVVISADIARDVLQLLPREGVLVLDDGTRGPFPDEIPRVSKYRPAEELAKDMLSLCADRIPAMHLRERNRQKITLVINMDGADSLFPAAPAVARVLSAMGRKTLYLSLEQIPVTSLYFSGTGTRGFNEMLYYVKSDRDNLFMRLETCMSTDYDSGIHFFSAPPGLVSPATIRHEDIAKLLSATDREGDFDEIVIATEPSMYELIPGLSEKAARVLIFAPGTASSAMKTERLFQELGKSESDITRLKDKTRLVIVKIGPYEGFDGRFPDIPEYYLTASPAQETGSGWLLPESDINTLTLILDSFERTG